MGTLKLCSMREKTLDGHCDQRTVHSGHFPLDLMAVDQSMELRLFGQGLIVRALIMERSLKAVGRPKTMHCSTILAANFAIAKGT